jgi:heterodisulfide reductase subunit C
MIAIAYRFLDPLDQGDRVMEAVSNGMYRCIMCGKCDELCVQQDIDHLELWRTLRDAAAKRGIVPSYAK